MNRDLILLRHGIAANADWNTRDYDRPLTPAGVQSLMTQAGRLRKDHLPLDWVYCSPSLRTRQTLEIFLKELDLDVTPDLRGEIYEASQQTLLSVINQIPDEATMVLLVGHNPGITELANYLCKKSIISMSPGAIVHLRFALESWNLISGRTGELVSFL